MAFQQLGTSYNVTDVDTDQGQNGVYARDAWNAVVPKIFTKFFWNFAKKRQQLSQVVLPLPPMPWAYLYEIPSEAASIITIWPRGVYTIWGQYIACNINPVWLDYQIITPVSTWNNTFAMYVMWSVAEFMAPVASQNADFAEKATKGRLAAEADAQVYISQTQTAIAIMSAPFISCRYNYPFGDGGPISA